MGHRICSPTMLFVVAVYIYRLVMISIKRSETAQKTRTGQRRRNSNPVAKLPHAAAVFRIQPFNFPMVSTISLSLSPKYKVKFNILIFLPRLSVKIGLGSGAQLEIIR